MLLMFVLRFLIYCRRARDVRLGATPPTYNQLSGMWLLSRLTAKVAMANRAVRGERDMGFLRLPREHFMRRANFGRWDCVNRIGVLDTRFWPGRTAVRTSADTVADTVR